MGKGVAVKKKWLLFIMYLLLFIWPLIRFTGLTRISHLFIGLWFFWITASPLKWAFKSFNQELGQWEDWGRRQELQGEGVKQSVRRETQTLLSSAGCGLSPWPAPIWWWAGWQINLDRSLNGLFSDMWSVVRTGSRWMKFPRSTEAGGCSLLLKEEGHLSLFIEDAL